MRQNEISLKEHDEIISDLERRLKKEGMICFRNEEYKITGHGDKDNNGEIDVYGINPDKNEIIAIEVKRSRNRKNTNKAHHQLMRDILFLVDKYFGIKIITMYAYGESHRKRKYNVELYSPKLGL